MIIEKWDNFSQKILTDGQKATLIDNKENLENKSLDIPLSTARKRLFASNIKENKTFSVGKLKSFFKQNNDNDSLSKVSELKSDNIVKSYNQIKNEISFFGEAFLEGFLSIVGLELENSVDRYEKRLHALEIIDVNSNEKLNKIVHFENGKLNEVVTTDSHQQSKKLIEEITREENQNKEKKHHQKKQILDESEELDN